MEDFAVAKLHAASKFPYLRELIMNMPIVVTQHPMLGVAALSKRMTLYISKDIIEEDILLLPQFILRDIFHLILHHADRYEQFKICSREVWTVAARMAIYCFMRNTDSLTRVFIDRYLVDPRSFHLPLDLTAEEYAELLTSSELPKEHQDKLKEIEQFIRSVSKDYEDSSGSDQNRSEREKEYLDKYVGGSVVHNDRQPWEDESKEDKIAPSKTTIANMIEAAKEALMNIQRGTERGNILRELEEYGCTAGIANLMRLLTEARRTSSKSGSSNLDVSRVRRRQYLEQYRMGYVIPPYTKNHSRVGVLIDTSGSMDLENELRMCIQCVNSFLRSEQYNEIMFYSGDTNVNNFQKLCRGQKPVLVGEGGTDVGYMIAEIEEMNKNKPLDYLIVFTDGWTPWGTEPSSMKVVAVITKPDHWHIPEWVEYVMIDDLFPHLKRRK